MHKYRNLSAISAENSQGDRNAAMSEGNEMVPTPRLFLKALRIFPVPEMVAGKFIMATI